MSFTYLRMAPCVAYGKCELWELTVTMTLNHILDRPKKTPLTLIKVVRIKLSDTLLSTLHSMPTPKVCCHYGYYTAGLHLTQFHYSVEQWHITTYKSEIVCVSTVRKNVKQWSQTHNCLASLSAIYINLLSIQNLFWY